MPPSGFTKKPQLQSPSPREPSGSSPCAACTVRELAVCSVLEKGELERLNSIMTNFRLSKGENLFYEGDDPNFVFNITGGTVQLSKLLPDGRRQVIGYRDKGDFLGLTNSQTYNCSAEAITDVKLCKFRRVDLESIFMEYPKLESHLLSMTRNNLADTTEQLLLLGRKMAIERVASFLLTLSDRAANRGEPDNPVFVAMGRHSVGDYLGLTTETVSRTLTRLKRRNVISLGNTLQSITILDKDQLADLAGGY